MKNLIILSVVIFSFWVWHLVFDTTVSAKPASICPKCARSIEEFSLESVVHYITEDHPSMWKAFWHQNYDLSQESPREFIYLLSKKNGEWISWLLQNEGVPIHHLNEQQLEYLCHEIVSVETEALSLPIVGRFDYNVHRLDLTDSELKQVNNKLYGKMLHDGTKKALLERVEMHNVSLQ